MMRSVCAALITLVFASVAFSQSLPDQIDRLVEQYVVDHDFMGSILVADKSEIIFAKGYGLANVGENAPNTVDTKFMIGSIAKQFTAMLVTQLAERGVLKFDNTISDFLPDFPKDIGERITVEMLLDHTSGLPFPEGIEKYYYASRKQDYLQELLNQLSDEGLRFEPGEGYGYSNAGYFILGLIIESATGRPYEEVLTEQILQPLGMSNTGCDRKGLVLGNRAVSYVKLPARYVTWSDVYSYDPAVIGFAHGSMYSTVGDLYKFSKAFSNNDLLSGPYLDMYLTMRNVKSRPPIPNIPDELVRELFGTCGNGFVGEISIIEDPATKERHTFYWHDGTDKLFKSNHFHFSEEGQVIIILSNCSFLGEGDEMVLRIHQLLNNKPYERIHMKHSLAQYLSEDVAMHAGIPAAIGEYLRFKSDTLDFIIPDEGYLIHAGRDVAERGDLDNAILILGTVTDEFPQSWEAYDALGETYMMRGDAEDAARNLETSLRLNPQNTHAAELLKSLETR